MTDTLDYENKNGIHITGIEVFITGNVKGEAAIEFENGAGRFQQLKLEGPVNQTYTTDWYETKCVFRYKPISRITGESLTLKYRMY